MCDGDVRRHARALLQTAEALPAADRPAEVAQLRRALIEAGEVDLAAYDDGLAAVDHPSQPGC
ncbi:hypothetical protein [Streptomyces tendae]|uniref:hypothetical protein n=1 Tax=Streptomyces tendae TaxID=1932 RepID=UPI00167A518B|nr:hypothetical protein [Streptomyces tendae]